MPDSITPSITRTNSVMPSSSAGTSIGPAAKGQTIVLPAPKGSGGIASKNIKEYVPDGFEYVGRATNGGIIVRRTNGQYPTLGPSVAESRNYVAQKAAAKAASDAEDVGTKVDYNARVQASLANRVSVDGATVDPDRATTTGGGVTAGLTVDPDTGAVTDADGNAKSASYAGRVAAQQSKATATFGALNLDNIVPSAQFVLSYGTPIDATTSAEQTSGNQDLRAGGTNASQQSAADKPKTQNMMTLAGGLQWFKTLSVKDKSAYNALVLQLRNAGYLSGDDEDLPLNGYSKTAGEAFTYAAADLASVAETGETTPLLDWLTQRGQGYTDAQAEAAADKAEADAYKPVDRSYTDPAAVKAQAKSAAIAALGRKLTDEEEARFEASFRGQENSYYDQIDAAGRAKTAATVADPNLSGQADAFVDDPKYDTERAGQAIGNYAQAFEQMMGVG